MFRDHLKLRLSGAAFELGLNRIFAILTIVGSLLLTFLVWFYLLGVAK